MTKIAIIQVSDAGKNLANTLQRAFPATIISRTDVGKQWETYDAFIFIGAMGICVRTIAPFVHDKHSDPAVVCVDSLGKQAISVLSGHIGGANDLTQLIATLLGANPVITTQSDCAGLWALDTFQKRFGWDVIYSSENMNTCIFSFVNRKPTALVLDIRDEGTDYMERTLPDHVTIVERVEDAIGKGYEFLIVVSPFFYPAIDDFEGHCILFIPRCLTIGFGLAHQAKPAAKIMREVIKAISEAGLYCVNQNWCSIDVKKDEPFVRALKREGIGAKLQFFTAEELAAVEVPNPSDAVQKYVGTPSVCEAAAILGSNHGQLIIPKIKGQNWTVALAISYESIPGNVTAPSLEGRTGGESAHIEIVGAGPGDPDLISVRGRKMLERADLILYAGSLVPKALTACHKPGAVVRSSADMDLEEQCELMRNHYEKGHFIVRLHTGDPCIFGAIQEQMAFFDAHGMHYHITPGISSFLAAAAELQSQFTIPERCQTIILTRGEGRTPMPEREQLHLLARSQSTMCIFLSAAIVDDVQRELLMEYPEDTPVAACYHLTWPDQRIYRGTLKDLAKIVHENHLTLTTMLVVGEAIDNRQGLSELYNKHFTHLFRTAQE
ncbi:MAG: precorrin-4 C(11)-methyltransferase [Bacteroidaceae bacterium]|nr:precorrin-4 C(11)-methyltransferase [Bacteroidaceae bacterium]